MRCEVTTRYTSSVTVDVTAQYYSPTSWTWTSHISHHITETFYFLFFATGFDFCSSNFSRKEVMEKSDGDKFIYVKDIGLKYKCHWLYLEYSILFEDYIEWKWHILCWFKTFCPRIYEIWIKLFSSNAEVPFILTENRSNFLQPHCRPQRDRGNIQIMQNSRINLHLWWEWFKL